MKVMTFNVLCGGPEHRNWEKRRELVTETIKKYAPDTFGLQEAHSGWMDTVCAALPEYDFVGIGRDDGKRGGEFSPVFYLKEKYTLVDSGNFWLSETPEKPGKGWDAACVRICSYAVLEDKTTKKRFVHFNTHLDHIGQTAMREGAKLIAERSLKMNDLPAIMTGDFNVEPDHPAYKTVIEAGFEDARVASGKDRGLKTYHAFESDNRDEWSLIDFVFIRNGFKAIDYKVVTDKIDGKLPSDHYPVVAELETA